MTPLAAQMFRVGDEKERGMLAKCQFFECSKLLAMSQEMGKADVDAGGDTYSVMAQLPAPLSVIEFASSGDRILFVCEQHDDEIKYVAWVHRPDGVIAFRFASGFTLGTSINGTITWASFPGEPKQFVVSSLQRQVVRGFSLTVEKMLCIINQPGLVDRVQRATDKRVLRLARATIKPDNDLAHWHEYRIRPGVHGETDGTGTGHEMPLHYVRKHLRPSSGKWVEGYWRGNADLGTHLKWYSATPPRPAA